MYLFGSGSMWGIPTADASGAAIANPTPVKFGVLQDVSIDISNDNKMLYGQNQFPVAVGRGKGKISLKSKFANINAAAFSSLFSGSILTPNITAAYVDSVGKAVPSTPFTITAGATDTATTIQIPLSGTWVRDLGVRNANGLQLTRVASAPTTGQYSVSAVGVYVFAAADVGIVMYFDYEYTATSTTAKQTIVTNQLMGYAPTFAVALSAPYQGKNFHLRFPQCISNKLSFGFKNDDFVIPELDFDAFADAAGNVYYPSLSE